MEVFDILQDIGPSYADQILIGDLNCNMLKSISESRYLSNAIDTQNLHLVNSKATHFHIQTNTFSQIDLIITSNISKIAFHSQISVSGISRHDLVYLSYNILPPKNKKESFSFRNFKQINMENLQAELNTIDWSPIYDNPDFEFKVDALNKSICQLFEKFVPLKTVTLKSEPKKWMNSRILQITKYRDNAYTFWKDNSHTDAYTFLRSNYIYWRNQVKYAIKKI